jgi:TatD DNase family protein
MLFKQPSKAYNVFHEIPVENVFFETDDAGYTIQEIYEKAAIIRKINISELKNHIMNNFARCFNSKLWNTG